MLLLVGEVKAMTSPLPFRIEGSAAGHVDRCNEASQGSLCCCLHWARSLGSSQWRFGRSYSAWCSGYKPHEMPKRTCTGWKINDHRSCGNSKRPVDSASEHQRGLRGHFLFFAHSRSQFLETLRKPRFASLSSTLRLGAEVERPPLGAVDNSTAQTTRLADSASFVLCPE